jgi:hypothetical protein
MAPEARSDGPIANLIQPAQKGLALRSVVVQNAGSAGRLVHCVMTSDRAEIGRCITLNGALSESRVYTANLCQFRGDRLAGR